MNVQEIASTEQSTETSTITTTNNNATKPAQSSSTSRGCDDQVTPHFTFQHLPNARFPAFENNDTKELLKKWDLSGHFTLTKYAYNEYFKKYQADDFLKCFFNDPNVQSTLQFYDSRGNLYNFRGTVKSVHKEELATSVVTMDFFDRLEQHGIVKSSGHISKTFDVFLDDNVTVSDKLREMFMVEESENYELYNDRERSEFIYHVMRRICTGGALNQYEDDFEPYSETTKAIYKDLVSVQKNPYSSKPEVISPVYQILDIDCNGSSLFARDSPYNFCYVIIDPLKRQVVVWHYCWSPMF